MISFGKKNRPQAVPVSSARETVPVTYQDTDSVPRIVLSTSGEVVHASAAFAALAAQAGAPFRIQFETMTGQDGRRYLVGSPAAETDDGANDAAVQQLKEAESIARMGHWRWAVGQDGVEWSDEIYRIFGVERGEFFPTLQSMNACVLRPDIGRVNQGFQRAIIEQNDYEIDFRVRRPGGEIRHIRCEGRCALDAHGDAVALYGIMQDMTERVAYEQELREAKDAAERAYAAKSTFLANMSHELRTPLNAIIGFSEMMQRQLLGPIGTEKYLEYVQGIRESGGHLLDIISDILDMSKIEAGKYELAPEEVNIGKVAALAVHMMQGRALDNTVKIALTGENDSGLAISADRRAVLQIILNLLSNAVKFSRKGGTVTMACTATDKGVSVRVEDRGIGIPANKLASITRPFEQAAPHFYSREHQGTGLGLAITKELTEMHGGTLAIESTVNIGTTVTVRLPRSIPAR